MKIKQKTTSSSSIIQNCSFPNFLDIRHSQIFLHALIKPILLSLIKTYPVQHEYFVLFFSLIFIVTSDDDHPAISLSYFKVIGLKYIYCSIKMSSVQFDKGPNSRFIPATAIHRCRSTKIQIPDLSSYLLYTKMQFDEGPNSTHCPRCHHCLGHNSADECNV